MQSKHHVAIQSSYEAFKNEIIAHTEPGFQRTEALCQASNARYWALESARDKHLLDIKGEGEENG